MHFLIGIAEDGVRVWKGSGRKVRFGEEDVKEEDG
jgi:hypothetical protein